MALEKNKQKEKLFNTRMAKIFVLVKQLIPFNKWLLDYRYLCCNLQEMHMTYTILKIKISTYCKVNRGLLARNAYDIYDT